MNRSTIKVDKLRFDPENPRVPLNMRELEIEEMLTYFISRENVFELLNSIATQGFVELEPVLVVPSPDVEGDYIVVEGNRRLAALLLLKNPELARIKGKQIKEISQSITKTLPEEILVSEFAERKDVLDYLGYRHITGVEEWDSLAKARYLFDLYNWHKERDALSGYELYQQLAKTIGSRADYVKKLIRGFILYQQVRDEGYYQIRGLDDDTFSFSLLTTAIAYANIATFIELKEEGEFWTYSSEKLKLLITWLFKENDQGAKRVSESRDLKLLSAVVASERAFKEFHERQRPLEEAQRYTDEPAEFVLSAMRHAKRRLSEAINQLFLVQKVDDELVELASEIEGIAKGIVSTVKGKLADD